MLRRLMLIAIAAASATAAAAQQHFGHQATTLPSTAHAPYARFHARGIKALSDEQIIDLRAGRGMSLALAAELNGHPGPMHVLEHAERLGLSSEQRFAAEGLMAVMRSETIAAGERLIAAEGALDRLFAQGKADEVSLAESIRDVAKAQGEVRRLHLKAHIATRAALTPEQISLYAKLRGY